MSDTFGVNGSGKRIVRRRHANDNKLSFHQLEDRRLLATFSVSNVADGSVTAAGDLPGSLRQAVFLSLIHISEPTRPY